MEDARRTRLAAAEARLARLEAKEATLAAFNKYLYLMDVGYIGGARRAASSPPTPCSRS